jgi:hypothetical protein
MEETKHTKTNIRKKQGHVCNFDNNSDKCINKNETFEILPRDRNRLVLNPWRSEDLHMFK